MALAERSVPLGLVSNAAPDLAAAFERSPLRPLFTTCTFSSAIEAETSDTYDPWRRSVGNWAGTRLRDLSDVLALVP